MSIVEKVRALIADAHEHGYANELPESVQRVFHAIAEDVEGLVHGAAPDVKALADQVIASLGEQMSSAIGALKADFEKAFAEANANIDQRIEAKFAELLAKAAAADKPADAPAEPAPQA